MFLRVLTLLVEKLIKVFVKVDFIYPQFETLKLSNFFSLPTIHYFFSQQILRMFQPIQHLFNMVTSPCWIECWISFTHWRSLRALSSFIIVFLRRPGIVCYHEECTKNRHNQDILPSNMRFCIFIFVTTLLLPHMFTRWYCFEKCVMYA